MSDDMLQLAYQKMAYDFKTFTDWGMGDRRLRPYQMEAATPIVNGILNRDGEQYAVVFSRQAGKDEMLAQLIAFILMQHKDSGGTVVVAAPTLTPQALISRDRLIERVRVHPFVVPLKPTVRRSTIAVSNAKAMFVSAAKTANARGLTADIALIANETQDIKPEIWDAVFDPMAASTNATTLFLGTVWTKNTLLSRQMKHLRAREHADGKQRVFLTSWERVANELPVYGDRVRSRMQQLGETHPFVRTEYFLEELDGEQSLFTPQRMAQMQGDHPRQHRATPGKSYALLLDVAGEEESGGGQAALVMNAASRRDSTALTVVEVDLAGGLDGRPVYRAVDRMAWTGKRHAELLPLIVDLTRIVWKAKWIVIDATGIGHGLGAFIESAFREVPVHVENFRFSAPSKSALGWNFLSMIDTGRYKEYADDGDDLTRMLREQMSMVEYEIGNGPGHPLKWEVPASVGHDDLVMSAALVSVLDNLDLRPRIARGS